MPPGVRRAVDLVKAPGEFALAVEELLAVATDLAEGLDLLRSHPQLQVVTLDGDLIGAHWARGGSAGAPSLIGMRAAAQDAAEALREAESSCQRAERDLADAADEEDRARQVAAEALARLQETDAEAAEISGSARWPVPPGRPATRQAGWPRGSPPPSAPGRTTRPGWPSWRSACPLPRRTRTLRRRPSPLPVLTAREARAERDRLAELAVAARNAEMDARLDVRTVEERLRAITGRADSRWPRRPPRNARPGSGPRPGASAARARPRWPAPWPRARVTQ